MGIFRQSFVSRLLNYRTPAQIINLEQSTKTHHESRYAPNHVLRDRHCDQNEDSETTILDFAYRCGSEALSVYVFSEVICPFSIASLEGKINLSQFGENVAQCVVFSEKLRVRNGILVQQFEDVHEGRIP